MKVIALSDFQQFSPEKMKKNSLFESPRFFCDIYCFEPGQEQKGHVHGEQDKVYLDTQPADDGHGGLIQFRRGSFGGATRVEGEF